MSSKVHLFLLLSEQPLALPLFALGLGRCAHEAPRADPLPTLTDARWFTRAEVLNVINSGPASQMSREEVAQIDGKEGAKVTPGGENTGGEEGWFRMPPA